MDPDAALENARQAMKDYDAAAFRSDDESEAAENLIAAFSALDGWMSNGGFTPVAWQTGPTRRNHI